MKYYKTAFSFDKENELEKVDGCDNYFKSFFEKELQLVISVRVFYGEEISVSYYGVGLTQDIKNYHLNRYKDKDLGVIKSYKNSLVIEQYKNLSFSGMEVFTFDAEKRELTQAIFDCSMALTQYCENIYENEDLINEKYFFPSQWKIQEESF